MVRIHRSRIEKRDGMATNEVAVLGRMRILGLTIETSADLTTCTKLIMFEQGKCWENRSYISMSS